MPPDRTHDRRTGTRFEIIGRLPGTVAAVGLLGVKNIGAGGVLIEAPWPLPLNSQHSARLELPVGTSFDVAVRVRHVTAAPHSVAPQRYSIGFEFVTLESDLSALIEQMTSSA